MPMYVFTNYVTEHGKYLEGRLRDVDDLYHILSKVTTGSLRSALSPAYNSIEVKGQTYSNGIEAVQRFHIKRLNTNA